MESKKMNFYFPKEYHNSTNYEYVMKDKINVEGNYSIKFFNKTLGGIHLHKIQIKRLLKSEFQNLKLYFEECSLFKIDIEKYQFSEWREFKKNYDMINEENSSFEEGLNIEEDEYGSWFNENHFLKDLFEDAKKKRELFKEMSLKFEEDFLLIRNKIQKINKETSLEELTIDSTLSDVFGTTTMEGQKETEEEIKELVLNKKGNNGLIEQEAKNIYDGFKFVSNNKIYELSIDKVKFIHGILTKNLDEKFQHNGLDYKSTEFRKEIVNIGLFGDYDGRVPPYVVPLNSEVYINELFNFLNEQKELRLVDIAIFHLFFYSTHPFYNGNKRTTRVIESGLIQQFFDNNHLCLGMGYFFKINYKEYFTYVKNVLIGRISINDWIIYYMSSFVKMGEMSLEKLIKSKKGKITDYVKDEKKHRYYDGLDDLMFSFYIENEGKEFSLRELKNFCKNKNSIQNHLNNFNINIERKIEKHINEGIISKRKKIFSSEEVYRVSLN